MKNGRSNDGQTACRRCGAANRGEPARAAPGLGPSWACQTCGWLTPVPGPRLDVDLRLAEREVPDLLEDVDRPEANNGDAVVRYADQVRGQVVGRIGAEVARDPSAAVTWLFMILEDLPDYETPDAWASLAVQQVYLHFLVKGAIPVFGDPVPELPPFWLREIIVLVMLWTRLSECLRAARLGDELRLVDNHLIVAPTNIGVWGQEVNVNTMVRPVPVPCVLDLYRDPLVRQAENEAFGVSVCDGLDTLADVAGLRRRTRVTGRPEHLIVDTGPTAPVDLRDLLGRFTLTRRRLSQQSVPDFLYAPTDPIVRSTSVALAESADFNWLKYAPVLLGAYRANGLLSPVAIVSSHLLDRSKVAAGLGVARRLVVAEQAAKSRGSEGARAIATLRQQFHAQLESRVAASLAGAGLAVVQNLAHVQGRQRECGEVDVLAGGRGANGQAIVIVCEVKDTDMSFYKDYGPDESFRVCELARKQAQRKAGWLATHWGEVRNVLGADASFDASETWYIALVVPRLASMPLGGPGPASIAFPELPTMVRNIMDTPPALWRRDLQLAIIVRQNSAAEWRHL